MQCVTRSGCSSRADHGSQIHALTRSPLHLHSSARGFTLIEMLAVVAILAILVAMSLSKLFSSLEKARIAKAIVEISQIHRAVEMARVTRDGNLPLQMTDLVPQYFSQPPVDPWGNAYVYNNFTQIAFGDRRKDGPLVPINKEYDIFSMGPNGTSTPTIRSASGKDDIILANDGGFLDVAEKY